MQMHSKFVKDLSDKTQISIRQIEAEWKVAEKQLNFDVLMDPAKYSHLKKMDGTMAEEISRRVESNLTNPQEAGKNDQEVLGFDETQETTGSEESVGMKPGMEEIPPALPDASPEFSEPQVPAESEVGATDEEALGEPFNLGPEDLEETPNPEEKEIPKA